MKIKYHSVGFDVKLWLWLPWGEQCSEFPGDTGTGALSRLVALARLPSAATPDLKVVRITHL